MPYRTVISRYGKLSSPIIPVPFGTSRKGGSRVLDIGRGRNIFIASSYLSDKEAMLDWILKAVLEHSRFEPVKFIFSSFYSSVLRKYEDNPHLLVPVIRSEKEALRVLDYVYDENTRRQQLFAKTKTNWIIDYNDRPSFSDQLPFIIYVIDEVACLMKSFKADFCRKVHQVAMAGRFTGVFLLFATSEVTSEVVREPLVKSFPTRIACRMNSAWQSKLVLGDEGAENLEVDQCLLHESHDDELKKITLLG